MGKRRWISVHLTKGLFYWSCPGKECMILTWREKLPDQVNCSGCGSKYRAIQIQNNRLLIEVDNEN